MSTRLRSVAVGVGTALTVELVGFLLFDVVTVAGGLLGSAVAGWLVVDVHTSADDTARTALRAGAGAGLLVACVVALAVVPTGVVLTLATGETRLVPFGRLVPRLGSVAAVAVVVGLGVTVPNTLIGAVGAWVRSRADRV